MDCIKKTYRIKETLAADILSIANTENQSETQTVETALKFYRDYYHMQNKATFINEQILNVMQAGMKMLENTINRRSNQLISELALQVAIQGMVIANSLEISQADLHRYRLRALDSLKERQRIFRMDEIVDE